MASDIQRAQYIQEQEQWMKIGTGLGTGTGITVGVATSGFLLASVGAAVLGWTGRGTACGAHWIYRRVIPLPKKIDDGITQIKEEAHQAIGRVENAAIAAATAAKSTCGKCNGGLTMALGFAGTVMSGAIYKGIEFLNLKADYERGEQMESAVKTCSLIMIVFGMGAIGLGLVRSVR